MSSSRRDFLSALVGFSSALLTGCVGSGLSQYIPPVNRAAIPPLDDELRLVAFGDWGDGSQEQITVSRAIDRVAGQVGGLHGGLLLGDNFYWNGVSSVDDSKWTDFFDHLYDTEQLGNLPWYAVLGNHDYYGNPEAQIDYTALSKGRWNMPAHYFRKDFVASDGTKLLTVLAIDTNERFTDWPGQLAWFEAELQALSSARVPTVVIGHHTIHSYSSHGTTQYIAQHIDPLLQRYKPLAYLCGHDHNMQLNESGDVLYAVLGSGGRGIYSTSSGPLSRFVSESYGFGLARVSRSLFTLELYDTSGQVLSSWSRELQRA